MGTRDGVKRERAEKGENAGELSQGRGRGKDRGQVTTSKQMRVGSRKEKAGERERERRY